MGVRHRTSIASRRGLPLKAHPTPQHLFTDTDLGLHVRHRMARLDHQACSLLPKLRVYFLRLVLQCWQIEIC